VDIDGIAVAKQFRSALKIKIANEGIDPPSQSYVKMKGKACAEVGINSVKIELSETVLEIDLLNLIETLNTDKTVNGILVQMPLPKHINEQNILLAIEPTKDVDGFHPINVGKMITGDPKAIIPCTPLAVLNLLKAYNIETSGKQFVVLGRSNIVGRPLANLLSQKRDQGNATVTLAHSRTKDLPSICKEADILIAAIGKPHFVTKDFIKPGAVIIDVGINRLNGKIVGDVDYHEAFPISSFITPVPGGVGPMTIAMLLENTYILTTQALYQK
jgi:methylenetetrahydrofolate dehydrogenase (NADP+) / methenyltetrahydrofolate cyclohydrolase